MPPIRTFDQDATSDPVSETADVLLRRSPQESLIISIKGSPKEALLHDNDLDTSIHSPLTMLPMHGSRRESTTSARGYFTTPLKTRRASKRSGTRSPVSHPHSISIKGMQLYPTVAFDTFWRFAAERKAIDDRRRSGMPVPWTDDPILRKYPFCNTFRVLDKVSQYIIANVIEKGSQDPVELVFRITLFNLFTKVETWELLQEELGPLTWATYDRSAYQEVLGRAKYDGEKLYTGSFQKPAPDFGFKDAYNNHLGLLEVFMANDLPGKLAESEFLADIFEWLAAFPGMGYFTTYQLLLNFSYSSVINFSGMDFVVPGLGASSGLAKLFGHSMARAKHAVPGIEVDVMRWLAKTQTYHFKRLGLNFTGLGPDRMPMELADIEHTLCEVDKYSRIAHPKLKGLGKRTQMRGLFRPSSDPYPAKTRLPKAWSHPARMVSRVRPGALSIHKRYVVARVGKRREGKNGVEYLVYWQGYSKADATWEAEKTLVEDAPEAVELFLSKGK